MVRVYWVYFDFLGLGIRFASFKDAINLVWHVLEVRPNSPAQAAGLIANTDWIIGSPDVLINSQNDFQNLLLQNKKRRVSLIVFSCLTDACRVVGIVPDLEWGGDGM